MRLRNPLRASSTRRRRTIVRRRRGAIVAMAGLLMVAMVGLFALAVDFGRLGNLKADLQTAADAAALAGAVELIPYGLHNPLNAPDTATAYALKNPAMQATVTVVESTCGTYFDVGSPVYIPRGGACLSGTDNAVRVVVTRASSGLFMSVLGVAPPVLKATAVAAVRPDLTTVTWAGCTPPNCRVYLVSSK